VLALDLRPRKAGFVVLEGNVLLDWGVRAYGKSASDLETTVKQRIEALLDLHTPGFVVVQRRRVNNPAVARTLGAIIRIVKTEATNHASDLTILRAGDVRQFFAEHDCHNKHEIASRLASWFEELAWKLPPKRKPWQSEDHNMTIFDAAAGAIAFVCDSSSDQEVGYCPTGCLRGLSSGA
jgi:hypothetical protein